MITRSDNLFESDVCTPDIVISDHSPVLCHLNLVKPLSKTKFVNFRNLKSICLDSFKRDISVSLACVDNSDISKLVSHYHEVLASTLNTHAPLKRRAVTVRVKKAPWYTPEIDLQKKVGRGYERRGRSTGLPSDKQKFSKQCAVVNKMLFLSKQQYFNSVVADEENDQHSLFKTVSNLLYPKQSPQYPPSSDDTCLANSFVQFFTNKIKGIRQGFSAVPDTVLSQLDIITCSSAFCCFKASAYKAMHSTETALVRIHNDILQSVDAANCVILIFLDMSAAFDTVVHDVLLDRLANRFGVRDVVLSWFSSYLTNRKQFLYLSFNGNQQLAQSRQSLEQCLTDISSWMLANGLKLNHDKTELMCIHSRFLSRPPLEEIVVFGETIVPCTSAVNLGIVFDECMTGELQVSKICKSSYFHLRNLSSIRKHLTANAAHTIVHAFISSRLDYCNALLYGLRKYLVDRLQHVQNSAARVVTFTGKFDHITPVLIDLHWLPVYYRVLLYGGECFTGN
ncbi:uncharacterized protein [Montipora capricornis]|uniref:uncharacterized protein n=1 Tax=Montipora capricornis TaxID=246305 RepID=UPI0035F1052C